MKLVKTIASLLLGRIIHAGIKAAFPITTDDPTTALVIGGAAGAGSILLGFAIVFGLSGYFRERNKTIKATDKKASGHESAKL